MKNSGQPVGSFFFGVVSMAQASTLGLLLIAHSVLERHHASAFSTFSTKLSTLTRLRHHHSEGEGSSSAGKDISELRREIATLQEELAVALKSETEGITSKDIDPSVFATTPLSPDDAQMYGFVSRSEGCRFKTTGSMSATDLLSPSSYSGPPANIVSLAAQAFGRNLKAIEGRYDEFERGFDLTPEMVTRQETLVKLTLNTTGIMERERRREVRSSE